ncbi:WD repeat-containing protein jip5 [Lasiodiplodia hormozganensis]|uniref:WD repeat-containing protein JIP5 n=1 Tax=Lasiodiplodia hormozganensis TaxID=869390 RepID=A0AA39YXI3_9PEZI|nr:WD repeat-containing protein jip5 [Lasiodiplodia hormozganensis]
MFDTICNLPLSSDLFAQAIHPTEPLVAVGLSAGHVQTFRLPPVATSDDDNSSVQDASAASENGFGQIETAWRTRRHKGSCRSLAYSVDGEALYSAGTDGLVKAASSETGQVLSKINVPRIGSNNNDAIDPPSLLHVLSPQTLLLATDSSPLHLFDLREDHTFPSLRASATHHPHDDYISSLTPMPPSAASTSGFSKQWVTTGGSTLAVTDLRRGVLVRSEDQEEELLSSMFVGGLAKKGSSVGEKILVGGSGGVLTLWERGVWDDQDERVTVDRGPGGGESLDVMAMLPDGVGPGGKVVAVGLGHGLVRFVRIGANRVIGEISHDETGEGVVALGFDVGGRLITGGGQVVKVWHEGYGGTGEDDVEDATEGAKRSLDSDDDDDSDDDSDADSSEDEGRKRRKKRKRSKGKDKSGGKPVVQKFKGLD